MFFCSGMGCVATAPFLSSRARGLGTTNCKFHWSCSPSNPDTSTSQSAEAPIPAPPPPIPSPLPPPVPSNSGTRRAAKRDTNLTPEQVRSFKERLRDAQPPGGYNSESAIATTTNIIKDILPDTVSDFFLPRESHHHFTILFAAAIGHWALLETIFRRGAAPRRGP
jgi:hypothetical protein